MCPFREDTQDFWFRDRALEDDQSCIQWVLVCSICRAIPNPCNDLANRAIEPQPPSTAIFRPVRFIEAADRHKTKSLAFHEPEERRKSIGSRAGRKQIEIVYRRSHT
jgi:hypothetical protein